MQQQKPNRSSLPPHRPHSTIPMTPHHQHRHQTASTPPSSYRPPTKRTTSFSPRYSQTPTFKRLTHASPHHRSRSSPMYGKSHQGDSSTPAARESGKIQQNMAAMDEIAVEEGGHENLRPHTVDGSRLHTSLAKAVSSGSSKRAAHTRRVWDKGSGAGSPKTSSGSTLKSSPSARNSRRAKYTPHHIPDPSSRCASSMVSSMVNLRPI